MWKKAKIEWVCVTEESEREREKGKRWRWKKIRRKINITRDVCIYRSSGIEREGVIKKYRKEGDKKVDRKQKKNRGKKVDLWDEYGEKERGRCIEREGIKRELR